MTHGRPSKLTPERQARMVEALAAMAHYEIVAARGGVTYQTFLNWRSRGEKAYKLREQAESDPTVVVPEKERPYLAFFDATTRAEAEAELLASAKWVQWFDKDWRAIRDFLARRHPDRWGPTMALTSESVIDKTIKDLEAQLGNNDPDSEEEEAWTE